MSAWASTSKLVAASVSDAVATITLDRPDKLNALTPPMLEDLVRAIRFYGSDGNTTGLVITGAGRAFSAGEDLHDADGLSGDRVKEAVERFNDVTRAILSTEVPVAAAINGIAVGGASELTLACDTRVAATSAEYYLPENSRGLTISNASSVLLPRMLGPRAMRLVLDSERIDAEEALRIGLVDAVVPDGELLDHVTGLLRTWSSGGRATAEHLKLMRPRLEELEPAMQREADAAVVAWKRGVTKPGVKAFLTRERTEDGALAS